jgi:DNA-binding PadR family transcriptional regulator
MSRCYRPEDWIGPRAIAFVRARQGGGGSGGGPWGGPGGGRGPWGGPGGGRGHWGGPGGGRGRRRRGDARIALLLLLAEEPRNGYQLIQEIEQRSDGQWRPSSGSVYPALSQLEDEGLIRGAVGQDTGRVFELTDAGRAYLVERGDQPAPWEAEENPAEGALADFRRAVISAGKASWQVAQDGDEQQIAKATELLADTRRALYRLLAGEDRPGEDTAAQE